MRTTAKGVVRHMFHGSYRAGIALKFDSPEEAQAAGRLLGWEWADQHPDALVRYVDGDGLKAVEEALRERGEVTFPPCGWRHCPKSGCSATSIGALTHSVDVGPRFEWAADVDVVDPRQLALLG